MKNKMPIYLLALFVMGIFSCSQSKEKTSEGSKGNVYRIKSTEEFQTLLGSAGDDLIILDLYADWCPPCKLLSPILEEVAREKQDKVRVYKINVDEQRDLAATFQVRSIPHVVFIKDQKVVYVLTGLRDKQTYVQLIDKLTSTETI